MKLDRNITELGRGKYALIKLRALENFQTWETLERVREALDLLERVGVLDYGTDCATDFFVIRLKDKYAAAALGAYGIAAYADDREYGLEVLNLAKDAAEMEPRRPD